MYVNECPGRCRRGSEKGGADFQKPRVFDPHRFRGMVKLVLVHQHDPTVPHVGGIQTFIDTFIRNAPEDFSVDLLGVTSQPDLYPVARWHHLTIGEKACRFFPLVAAHPVNVQRIPLSMRMLWALYRYRSRMALDDAILEFHRVEPMLGFTGCRNRKVLFIHGHNWKDFYNRSTEVRWGRAPWLYFQLERRLLPRASHVYLVREDAAADYRKLYPDKREEISFLPTWVDETVFCSMPERDRREVRKKLLDEQGIPPGSKVLLFVGRYEGQKDPLRLLAAFRLVRERDPGVYLVLIGEGALKRDMQEYVAGSELSRSVVFLPPMMQNRISEWMNAADALCLSSAFEGMPRAAVEALHCGLPVVGTAVGETRRLIGDRQGGRLVADEGDEPFASAVLDLIDEPPDRESCRRQVEAYTAVKVLAPVYDYYRRLAEMP